MILYVCVYVGCGVCASSVGNRGGGGGRDDAGLMELSVWVRSSMTHGGLYNKRGAELREGLRYMYVHSFGGDFRETSQARYLQLQCALCSQSTL